MKNTILLILLSLLFLSCSSEKVIKKIVTTYQGERNFIKTDHYDRFGNIVNTIYLNPDGSERSKEEFEYKYDSNKNIIEKNELDYNHHYPSGRRMVYKYDSNNNLIEEYIHEDDRKNERFIGLHQEKRNYKYDSNDNLVEEVYNPIDVMDSKGIRNIWKTLYDYNEKNNMIKKSFFINDNLREYSIFEYNNNLLIEESSFNENHSLSSKVFYEYDIDKNMIQKDFLDETNDVMSFQIYKYDINGNMIEESEYFNKDYLNKTSRNISKDFPKVEENQLFEKTTYEYEYYED